MTNTTSPPAPGRQRWRIFTAPVPRRFDWGFRLLMAAFLAVAAGCAVIVAVGFANPDMLGPALFSQPSAGDTTAATGDARVQADCDQLHWRQPTPELDQLAARELVDLASVCGRYPAPAGAVR